LVIERRVATIEHMFVLEDLRDSIEKLLVFEGSVDVAELARLRSMMDAAWLRAVAQYDRSQAWSPEYSTPTAGLRHECNLTSGAAASELKLARKLRELPLVDEALAEGSITRRHAAAIAEVYTPERTEALRDAEELLVDAAKVATPRQMGEIAQRVAGAVDGDDGAGAAYEKFCRRSLHASRTLDGMVRGDFLLDPVTGEEFLRALDAMQEQTYAKSDRRTGAQRRADAMMDLVRVGVSHAELGAGSSHRPEITVCVDLADLEDRGATDLAAEIRSRRGPYSKETLRRLTCDAGISRLLTDGPSQVLDVGRKQRNPTAAQRRAVIARDGPQCSGCGAHTPHLEIHHDRHWTAGGETNVDNPSIKKSHPSPQETGPRVDGRSYGCDDQDGRAAVGGDLLPDLPG
jgi:hypothetical protein